MTASDCFKNMAARIEHNADSKFGGAVVIYPPDEGGDPIEVLLLDQASDPVMFWQTVQSRIAIVLETLKDKQRQSAAFGRR